MVSHTISRIKERRQKVTAEKLPGKSTLRLGLGPLVIEDFLLFLIRSASAKRKVILIRRAHAILESLYFPMHLFERICVRLVFHDVSPQPGVYAVLHLVSCERLRSSHPGSWIG